MSYKEHIKNVPGKKINNTLIFALSTCVWCKKTKVLIKELGAEYNYVDVDLLDEKDRKETRQEIVKCNPKLSFPTIIIEGKDCILGFDEETIRKEFSGG